ncbi:SRPBCC family protein [Streptomyces inhibens]|uniref:SRPBCC family protein n=1 Tax=Streptomyces inhibens TaxID=2293571 RepID=A0A371PWV8_STRIH|nr:SRPBCC family protein [Streptomyces inhibens]REK86945.1 SRPBCC family protein [Streptomyces inhibens]
MAVRHRLIRSAPEAVWSFLCDGERYGAWVVGTSESHEQEGNWPQVGSAIEYTVRVGPWTLKNQTTVRRHEPPKHLEMEVDSGVLGTVRISLELRPWGDDTLVILDEHPLRGLGGALHNVVLDVLIQVRHRTMLARLAQAVEERSGSASVAS